MADRIGIEAKVHEISSSLDGISSRGLAVIFGACGKALMPLMSQAEIRIGVNISRSLVSAAFDRIEEFATGRAGASDHGRLREPLMDRPFLENHPWGTFVQDIEICADAGLAAASIGDRPS